MKRYINKPVKVPDWCRRNIHQVTNRVFIADADVAYFIPLLDGLGIKRVISILEDETDMPKYNKSNIIRHHKKILLDDQSYCDIRRHFEDTYTFIHEAPQGENVLIHCMAGISRSATLVVSYLMRKFKIGYRTAMQYLEMRRPIVDPNPGFRRQLRNFQEELYYTKKRRKQLYSLLIQATGNQEPVSNAIREYLYSCSFSR